MTTYNTTLPTYLPLFVRKDGPLLPLNNRVLVVGRPGGSA